MRVKNCFSFWLMHLSLEAAVSESLHIHNYQFVEDSMCDQFHEMKRSPYLQETTQSKLTCAGRCAHNADCEYVRVLSLTNSTNWCEIYLCNKSSQQLPLQPLQLSKTSAAGIRETCYKCVVKTISGNQSPGLDLVCEPSGDPEENSLPTTEAPEYRVAFIDTNNPETLTADYLVEFEDKHLDAKAVFRDEDGVHYALVVNFLQISDEKCKLLTTYVMDKTVDGFTDTATRIAYSMAPRMGKFYRVLMKKDRTSWTEATSSPEMQVYIPSVSEYSLIADVNVKDVPTLISWVRQGFKALTFTHATIWDDETGVSFYLLNRNPNIENNGVPRLPFELKQITEESFKFTHKGWSRGGRPLSGLTKTDPSDIAFSPLWRRAVGTPSPSTQAQTVLNSLMVKGHKFRVSHDNSFFDVNDVIKIGNDMYFALPQQVKGHPRKFSENSVGLRAVLSLWGNNFWCSHRFEGTVLDSGSESDQTNDYFVDKKTWMPLLSVFSNGTVASGRVSDIADAALSGVDVNVLIEWLAQDKARLLSVIMVSVNNYKTPGVVVSAESFVTWHLDHMSRELSSRCDMEKVLIKSNGDVQVLVYNTRRTQAMFNITDIKSTWFVF